MQNVRVSSAAGVRTTAGEQVTSRRPKASATLLVSVVRLVVVVVLATVFAFSWTSDTSEVPDTFSAGSWAWMLIPPVVLTISLALGLRLRVPHASRRELYLSRASATVAGLALVVACACSFLYFLGELFDYAI